MKRLTKFGALCWAERELVIKALLTVAAVRIGLWTLPFSFLRRMADRIASAPSGREGAQHLSADFLARTVVAVGHYVPKATCLTLSLAGYILLKRHGHIAYLRIGVCRAEHGRMDAHAWIEWNDRIIIGDHEPGLYKPLMTLLGPHLKARP